MCSCGAWPHWNASASSTTRAKIEAEIADLEDILAKPETAAAGSCATNSPEIVDRHGDDRRGSSRPTETP